MQNNVYVCRNDNDDVVDNSNIQDNTAANRVIAGRPLINVRTRRLLSFLHILALLLYTIAAIISLYDGLSEGSAPRDYVYDNEATARAAGVDANLGTINRFVYLVLLIAVVISSVVAVLWEWVVYKGIRFVGLDLTYNNVDVWSTETATEQARRSFSPRGQAYRTYMLSSWYAYITTLALYIFHIGYGERPANRFGMVLVPTDTILVVFFIVAMFSTYYEELDVKCLDFVFSGAEAKRMTTQLRRYARRRRLYRRASDGDGVPRMNAYNASERSSRTPSSSYNVLVE